MKGTKTKAAATAMIALMLLAGCSSGSTISTQETISFNMTNGDSVSVTLDTSSGYSISKTSFGYCIVEDEDGNIMMSVDPNGAAVRKLSSFDQIDDSTYYSDYYNEYVVVVTENTAFYMDILEDGGENVMQYLSFDGK